MIEFTNIHYGLCGPCGESRIFSLVPNLIRREDGRLHPDPKSKHSMVWECPECGHRQEELPKPPPVEIHRL